MGVKVAYNPGPNRAQRRGTHMAKRHCSKAYSRGRASWTYNWARAFGQPKWRRTKETSVAEA